VSEYFNEYQLQHHSEGRRKQLLEEARQERLKAEMVHAARQQRQMRPLVLRLPNLFMRLRTALRIESPRPIVQDCPPLESSTP
jgi:hypothetical protein